MRKKLLFTLLFLLVLGGLAGYVYINVPLAEGTRSGRLLELSGSSGWPRHWIGRMQSVPLPGMVQAGPSSSSFTFYVKRPSLADSLKSHLGDQLVLHYRTYSGCLPWQGGVPREVDRILFSSTPDQGR